MSVPSHDLRRAAVALVSRHLIPFLFFLYILNFLDRVNVGFAALEMNRDLGFGPAVYGLGAGVFSATACSRSPATWYSTAPVPGSGSRASW